MPLASFMLLSGLCDTATWWLFRIFMSAAFTHTPWLMSVRGPKNLIESRYPTGERPACAFFELPSSVSVSAT